MRLRLRIAPASIHTALVRLEYGRTPSQKEYRTDLEEVPCVIERKDEVWGPVLADDVQGGVLIVEAMMQMQILAWENQEEEIGSVCSLILVTPRTSFLYNYTIYIGQLGLSNRNYADLIVSYLFGGHC